MRHEPRIYHGGLTNTWWCATKWRVRADGIKEAIEKHDVTDQIERIIAAALEQARPHRDYATEYAARQERARAQGFTSFYDKRRAGP